MQKAGVALFCTDASSPLSTSKTALTQQMSKAGRGSPPAIDAAGHDGGAVVLVVEVLHRLVGVQAFGSWLGEERVQAAGVEMGEGVLRVGHMPPQLPSTPGIRAQILAMPAASCMLPEKGS